MLVITRELRKRCPVTVGRPANSTPHVKSFFNHDTENLKAESRGEGERKGERRREREEGRERKGEREGRERERKRKRYEREEGKRKREKERLVAALHTSKSTAERLS